MKIGDIKITKTIAIETSWRINKYVRDRTFHCAGSDLLDDLYKGNKVVTLSEIVEYIINEGITTRKYTPFRNSVYIVTMYLWHVMRIYAAELDCSISRDEFFKILNRELDDMIKRIV
jgi:hypothetical protein